jgi:hypothetical protein
VTRTNTPPSEQDIETVKRQINTKRSDPYSVAVRCVYGYPTLIVQKLHHNNSIDFEYLSNPIWLTCPYLNNKIHELENDGFIKKISEFMHTDRLMKTHMHDAHAEFYFYRKKLFAEQFGKAYPEVLTKKFNLGIGGIKDIDNIKCLHLHFGHFLICKKNEVGYVTKHLLNNKIYCDDGRCRWLEN